MEESLIKSRFGASVRNLRHRQGLSQEALAERSDLHRTYIAGIESGMRNVTLNSIYKLAHGLQISTSALLGHAAAPGGRAESVEGECADILMVEDNRDDVELALRAFSQARIANTVHVVYDGREALDFLFGTGRYAGRRQQNQPHLVLLDLNLPKVGGLEVLARVKADLRTRNIPVVVLTISRDLRELAECRRLGAETHIIKPVDFQTLSRATRRLQFDWALLKPSLADHYGPDRSISPEPPFLVNRVPRRRAGPGGNPSHAP